MSAAADLLLGGRSACEQIEHIRNLEATAAMDRHRIMELESMVRRLTPSVGAYAPPPPPPSSLHHRGESSSHNMMGAPHLSMPGPASMSEAPPTPTSHHFGQPPPVGDGSGPVAPPQYWPVAQQHPQQIAHAQAALTALPPVSTTPEVFRERM